jgi:hypothetical protein
MWQRRHIYFSPNCGLTNRRDAWFRFDIFLFNFEHRRDAFRVVFVKQLLRRFCGSEDL